MQLSKACPTCCANLSFTAVEARRAQSPCSILLNVSYRAIIPPILARYPGVHFAVLFGSTARGDDGPGSDVDIAFGPFEIDVLGAQAELSEALGKEVDLVFVKDAPIPLLEQIIQDGVTVYERTAGAGADFRSRTISMLETDGPWYARMRDAFLKRTAERR
jgi:predicted nucleotidyltransferase